MVVFRFSSLGDVAMTVPVIRLLLQQHPSLRVTMVSNGFVAPLFANIDRLQFFTADLKGKHKGVRGLFRLYRELKRSFDFDAIADLHGVLRTRILLSFFLFSSLPKAVINKGRSEKREATRMHHKILKPLKSTFQRYADVFHQLGLPVQLPTDHLGGKAIEGEEIRIGIAPFAQYEEKMYPLPHMKEVIRLLQPHDRIKIFLFGGKADADLLQQWEKEFPHVRSMAGKMSFERELTFISNLHLMVSMDSANMHFASLFGVPVVSVWGGTHPWLGFYGWRQSPGNAVQADLDCRPSSVFGNKPCPRQGECMRMISPFTIYHRIMDNIDPRSKTESP